MSAAPADDTGVSARLARMLRMRLYVGLSSPTGPAEALARHVAPHLDHMVELERRGVLFASGPFVREDGSLEGGGMAIVRAASWAEAERLLARDPFHRAGVRSFDLRGWQLNEGAMNVRLTYSDQGLRLI